jgi:large subunit ribosomal protein L31
MKAKIHPKYYPDAKVTCTCGASFTTGSTQPEMQIEICASCHPFFTGEMKFVDTQGRVEKFQARQKAVAGKTFIKKKDKKSLKRKKEKEEEKKRPKTLREMLKKPTKAA